MIRIVTGLPGSGKSTLVKNNMKPGDIVYDLDRIAGALTMKEEERENMLARKIAVWTRKQFLDVIFEAMESVKDADCYIISTNPNPSVIEMAKQYDEDVQVFFITTKFVDRKLPAGVEDGVEENIIKFLDRCEEMKVRVIRIV